MRRFVRNAKDIEAARRYRQTFVDREPKKQTEMPWNWPKSMHWIGYCESVMYTSDKWKRVGTYEDYKHVAEGEQYVLTVPGFMRDFQTKRPLELEHESVKLPKMPGAFAELADIFGIQVKTFDDQYLQVDIARAKLGGAECPEWGPFLFVYNKGGVYVVIHGVELAIEKDGITG